MRVTVTGATGTIGVALVRALRSRGDDVVALTRDPEWARSRIDGVEIHAWASPGQELPPDAALAGSDAVIHLLGATVSQRWTDSAKRSIRDSRVRSTRLLVRAMRDLPVKDRPASLIAQSATGIYGSHGAEWLGEDAAPGADFLARVVVDWEAESLAAAALDVRVVVTRTGVVLSPHGGALEKMLPPFRMGFGGRIAGGDQYIPWVHLDDVVGAILYCLEHESAKGPINVVSPNPVTNAELTRVLGRTLRRPAVMPVPAVALRALYGEMAMMVVGGQRVSPAWLLALGYTFRYPDLEPALRELLEAIA
jgi:uncharacterized protein (TIGR01777 family)